MDDLKQLMQNHFLSYASYVILDRAIPNVYDGLKPVQRRILYTLRKIHDGKLHKVANVAGQTMALHPHGDAPITEALVNMANKGFLLDTQGNFGNLYTGDPASASRYIETRLSDLALETMFNPDLTTYIPSYDGRNNEPTTLPAKVPLILMQGVEGIAVGMSTKILPHNFIELLEAEIAILEGEEKLVLPDFPTGGLMDPSAYDKGKGKVKLRAKIEVVDKKTLVIREICYGTTTESLIRSIDEAAKRGKIKIDSINDYTAEKVEIEIKLPRGQYAEDLIKGLYAYTDCEISLNSQILVIKDGMPWEADVNEILKLHTKTLKGYLKRELEIEKEHLENKIYDKTLEQIFIENRLYKHLEKVKKADQLHPTLAKSLKPFHKQLSREPNEKDLERLLNIPIRRISQFDLDKNQELIAATKKELKAVEKHLSNMKLFTINYLKKMIEKYKKDYPRKTQITQIAEINKREIAKQNIKIGFDTKTGFVGTKVQGDVSIAGTNFDKLLVLYENGTYQVINIPEKEYLQNQGSKPVYVGIADKKTVFNVAYRDPKTKLGFVKRFIIKKFILGKEYRFIEEGMKLDHLTTDSESILKAYFVPKVRQKHSNTELSFKDVLVKGVSAKGIRIANRPIKKIKAL